MEISKVLDQNSFKKIKVGNECYWFGEKIYATKLPLIF